MSQVGCSHHKWVEVTLKWNSEWIVSKSCRWDLLVISHYMWVWWPLKFTSSQFTNISANRCECLGVVVCYNRLSHIFVSFKSLKAIHNIGLQPCFLINKSFQQICDRCNSNRQRLEVKSETFLLFNESSMSFSNEAGDLSCSVTNNLGSTAEHAISLVLAWSIFR